MPPARHGELTDAINAQPAPPPAAALTHLASYLPQRITADGSATERKAAVEALIHEIRITEQGLIPVYRIPAPDSPVPGHDDASQAPVRTMGHSVGRTLRCANQPILIEGDLLPVRLSRSRTVKGSR